LTRLSLVDFSSVSKLFRTAICDLPGSQKRSAHKCKKMLIQNT